MLPDTIGDLLLGSRSRRLCAARSGAVPQLRRHPAGDGGSAWPSPTPSGLVVPFAAAEYAGLVRAMVLAHKERGVLDLAGPLGWLLAGAVAAALADHPAGPVVLVPVPSRAASVRSRGHDPTQVITLRAAAFMRAADRPALAASLLRLRPGVRDQAGLDAEERRANLNGSMRCSGRALARLATRRPRAHVVVCDDVLTTAATAREAQRALEAVGLRSRRDRGGGGHPPTYPRNGKFRGTPFVATGHGLTSVHGVRPGPWLRRVGALHPIRRKRSGPASRCQSQAKRST